MNNVFGRLILSCFFLLLIEYSHSQTWTFLQKVVEENRRFSYDAFGQSLSMSEDIAIIGAWGNDFDQAGNNYLPFAGAVYLYQKSEAGVWSFIKKIVASDRTVNDGFGSAVAMDGNYAVIGAPFEGLGAVESAGAVYVFENRDGEITEVNKLLAPDREYLDEFGSQVAISGDWIIVGSPRDGEDENGENTILGAGSAYLYHRNGSDWAFTQKIVASDRGNEFDFFGSTVAISGDYAAISGNGPTDSGYVYIFKNGGGVWTEVQKLRGIDAAGFGRSVTMNGNRLIVGSGGNNSNGNEYTGSAYIFENIGGVWTEIKRLEASDGRDDDFFGGAVATEGDYIVVGASSNDYDENGQKYSVATGAAYIYQKNTEGVWTEIQKIVAPDRKISNLFVSYPQYFGCDVGISRGTILCGANYESYDENGENYVLKSGAAYFFQEPLLPLGFSALTGERKNNINTLYWQTYNETNLQNMVVEWSTDGIHFKQIANITPQHKAAAYRYEDATAVAGVTNFYRISFQQADGRAALSNTINMAANAIPFTVSVMPNPFTTKFSVVVNSGLSASTPMNVHWYNTAGRLVYTETRFLNSGNNTLTFNTAALAKGVYMVEFVLSDGRRKVEKVVKE